MLCRRNHILCLSALMAIAVVILAPLACDEDKKDPESPEIRNPEDFLPQSTEGWTLTSTLTATTEAQLRATTVNGGPEPWLNNNFRAFAEGLYSGTIMGNSREVKIWICEVATESDALNLYTRNPDEGYHPVNPTDDTDELFGDASLIERSFITRIIFIHGVYWVQILVSDTGPDVDTQLHAFAGSIDAAIGE